MIKNTYRRWKAMLLCVMLEEAWNRKTIIITLIVLQSSKNISRPHTMSIPKRIKRAFSVFNISIQILTKILRSRMNNQKKRNTSFDLTDWFKNKLSNLTSKIYYHAYQFRWSPQLFLSLSSDFNQNLWSTVKP